MDKGPGVLIANQRVPRSGPAPSLRLLVELEPRHRVFFRNLTDLILMRQVPPRIPLTSFPARFWSDVFVPSRSPWSSFLASMLCHLLLIILFVWGQSKVWAPVKLFSQQAAAHRSITFPAAESRVPSVRPRSRMKQASAHAARAHQPAMPVAPGQKPRLVTPPDLKQATAKLPNLVGSHAVTPIVPFSATAGLRRNKLTGPSGVVGPPPQLDQAATRSMALPQASAVAPAPELGGSSATRAVKAPNAGGLPVIPPPPSVQNAGNSSGAGRLSSGLSSLSGEAPAVVPPPPSAQRAGNAVGDTRLSSMEGKGSQVVPPPPSVQGAPGSGGGTRLHSLSGDGPQIIPPPPVVEGAGNSGAGGRLGSLSGNGSQIVPPPPAIEGGGSSGAGGRLGSLSGNGSQIVPPPPSVEVGGNSRAGGRLGSLSGNGSQIAPPSRSGGGGGNPGASGPGKLLEPMDPLPFGDASPAAAGNNESKSPAEELSLGSLGLVFAAPGTSYFSNFEVFVAKRRVAKDQVLLIKLVYEFLPYQRRLSEYDLSRVPRGVIKLRVTPDPSCNETLGRIMQPYTVPTHATTQYPQLPPALRGSDLNAVLPCYRTTADDFQKAMSRAR